MRCYIKPLIIVLLLIAVAICLWPLIKYHLADLKMYLLQFKHFSAHHRSASYAIYAAILCAILLLGLPVATGCMLMAGILFGFWEATTLVTLSRLTAAVITFMIVRTMTEDCQKEHDEDYADDRLSRFLKKFENNSSLGLFIIRLAPIPDSMVNYTMSATPIARREYIFWSLMGMIPFTVFSVLVGEQLGSITNLIRYLH